MLAGHGQESLTPNLYAFNHHNSQISFSSFLHHPPRAGSRGTGHHPHPPNAATVKGVTKHLHFLSLLLSHTPQAVMDAPPGARDHNPYFSSERNFLTRPPTKRGLFLIILPTFISSPASALQMLNN